MNAMTTEPIRPDVLEYLREERDRALLAAWPVQPSAELVPVQRQLPAQLPVPRREVTLFTPDPIQQTQVEAQRDVAIALKRASTGLAFALGGLGVWFAGMGVHQIGAGIKDAGAVSLWAIAAMFMSTAVARVFSPRRAGSGNVHLEVRGNGNRIRL
jgi:hypothetical protein